MLLLHLDTAYALHSLQPLRTTEVERDFEVVMDSHEVSHLQKRALRPSSARDGVECPYLPTLAMWFRRICGGPE